LYEIFKESYTQLGKLFVAVGITELSNSMASYTTYQEVFIKTFYSFGYSCVAAERQYCRIFLFRVAPSRDAVCLIIKQFEETGSMCVS
jgi:hypothetical protein